LSYDGKQWRNLPLEQPWATFARFQVDSGKKFLVRITATGYPSLVKTYGPTMSKTANTNTNTTANTNTNTKPAANNGH